MIRFFRKLFKRGDFMTRADKAYYKYRAKTIFWSAFCLIIISWVGTNLVLCALTTNVKSGGDIIYEAPMHDVYLPTGKELNKVIKNDTDYYTTNSVIKTITFDKYTENKTYFAGGGQDDLIAGITPETVSVQDGIYLYRLNDGVDIYILSKNNMIANDDCSYSFYNLTELTSIDYSNYDASKGNIVDMSYLFYYCHSLDTFNDLSKWNTKKVVNMRDAFCGCDKLSSLSVISGWDTSLVENMAWMFGSCPNLTSLSGISNWKVTNVSNMEGLFYGCSSLTSLSSLSGWSTDKLESMFRMFYGCKSLTSLSGIRYWDVSAVKDMSWMFEDCKALTSVDLNAWNTKNVESMSEMFSGCSNLSSISVSGWNTANVDDIRGIFGSCGKIRTLDLSGWDTKNVGSLGSMFYNCSALTTIYVSTKFVTTRLAGANIRVFYGCTSLVGGKGTTYNSSFTDKTYARIDGGPSSSTPGYFTQK